ncbi:DUF4258 domain-containing protein [Curtobacterium sp. MCBD17_030]|uniref:DUF4258 domain-containing protein n=1 Tax=Curtobacterium sp. MCBD17_030 TaxID=2175649 RepID=UPI0015E8D1B5|nr:DUF4258 domain-containing protein [Curtobacterium sp. MCBD17_030]
MTTNLEPQLLISAHAHQRMKEMGVSEAEVRSAVAFPMGEGYSSFHRSHIYNGRRIAVCVANEPGADEQFVKTIFWSDLDAAAFLAPDRVQHLTAA